MALAFLARFLFGLALLAQVAASVLVRAPTASGSHFCVVTHTIADTDARGRSVVDAASEQAPQRETGHRHGQCSFCLFGAGDPPLYSRTPVSPTSHVVDRARFAFRYCDGMVFFHTDRNAAARAPPAVS